MTTEKWYPFIKLPLTIEQFHQLPRNPAYKYEYIEGEAWLTARPRTYHALLTLEKRTPASTVEGFGREEISVRKLDEDDWEEFPSLFAWAFHRVVPFSLISDEDRLTAATQCVEHVRKGGDGPLIKDACYVARCDTAEGGQLFGAILITLMQNGELERFDDPTWKEHAPDNALAAGWGRPHLTWIFTDHWNARHGIGSLLLDHAVNALLDLGYTELASTFLLGNESSTLWHWRNGFQLKSYPSSPRALDRRSTAKESHDHVE